MKHITSYCIASFLQCLILLPCAAQSLTGVWENTERFIEYTERTDNTASDMLRIVLKTYYRFVYEDMGTYPVTAQQGNDSLTSVYTLAIRYPRTKEPMETDVWIYNNEFFTSFYQKVPYSEEEQVLQQTVSENEREQAGNAPSSLLDGFWVEHGSRDGLLIYRQEAPAFFDALFFTGTQYIRFRYWKGDIAYKEQAASFTCEDGRKIAVPKMFRRNDTVYSCITSNGSILRNYEKGSFFITENAASRQLTLTPQGGGPGKNAVGDVYPHQKYPQIQGIPLSYDEKGAVFAFGAPFLTRSSILNLSEEVTKHNSLKRPPPEPLLKADELDFYWERIKELRKEN